MGCYTDTNELEFTFKSILPVSSRSYSIIHYQINYNLICVSGILSIVNTFKYCTSPFAELFDSLRKITAIYEKIWI